MNELLLTRAEKEAELEKSRALAQVLTDIIKISDVTTIEACIYTIARVAGGFLYNMCDNIEEAEHYKELTRRAVELAIDGAIDQIKRELHDKLRPN